MAEENEKQEEGAEVKKKSKLPLIIIIVVVVLLLGGGAFFFLSGGEEPKTEESEQEQEVAFEQVMMEPFIVNLSDNSNYLKATLVLEYDPALVVPRSAGLAAGSAGNALDRYENLPGVLGEREAVIRDAIIRVLSSKNKEQVLSPEGKEILKEELLEAINDASGLDEPPIVAVYFTEFIVQ